MVLSNRIVKSPWKSHCKYKISAWSSQPVLCFLRFIRFQTQSVEVNLSLIMLSKAVHVSFITKTLAFRKCTGKWTGSTEINGLYFFFFCSWTEITRLMTCHSPSWREMLFQFELKRKLIVVSWSSNRSAIGFSWKLDTTRERSRKEQSLWWHLAWVILIVVQIQGQKINLESLEINAFDERDWKKRPREDGEQEMLRNLPSQKAEAYKREQLLALLLVNQRKCQVSFFQTQQLRLWIAQVVKVIMYNDTPIYVDFQVKNI